MPLQTIVLMRVGGRGVGVPVADVIETMRPLPISEAPLADGEAPPYLRGLAIIRGAPVPVVEGAALLGERATEEPRRFAVLRVGSRRVALAVDEVIGVHSIDVSSLSALPPLLAGLREAEAIRAIAALDGALLAVLDAMRLLPEDLWPHLGSAA